MIRVSVVLMFVLTNVASSQVITVPSEKDGAERLAEEMGETENINVSYLEQRAIDAGMKPAIIARARSIASKSYTWHDATGSFSIKAMIHSFDKKSVVLITEPDKRKRVPFEKIREDSLSAVFDIVVFYNNAISSLDKKEQNYELIKRLVQETEKDRRAMTRVLNKYKYNITKGTVRGVYDPLHDIQTYLPATKKEVNEEVAEELIRINRLDKYCYRPVFNPKVEEGHLVEMPPGASVIGPCDHKGVLVSVPLYNVENRKVGEFCSVAYGLSFEDIDKIDTTEIVSASIFSRNAMFSHTVVTHSSHLQVGQGTEFIVRDRITIRDNRGNLYRDIPVILQFTPPIKILDAVLRELNN